ncbi:hypothetical protein GCM10023085_08640 [Actinomadura viridis]|uniref:histidine kinase n=1 Tax=Actinomadura viridis TaxID=58110 RepID=A0A931DR55_9ACTN|nr:sensor histidine kinase [Actinomadura viridis]MBG6091875.1 signal transduction histidine kinase [Actinomadura viridis]
MTATPRFPLLRSVPPAVWAIPAWCGGALYPLVMFQTMHLARFHGFLNVVTLLAALQTVLIAYLLRRRPLPALALLVTGWTVATLEMPGGSAFLHVALTDLAAGYVAAVRPRRVSLTAAALVLGSQAAVAGIVAFGQPLPGVLVLLVLAMGVAWMGGDSVRQGRRHAEELAEQRAEQLAARAVTAERLRIARELHDMVAHSIGIIAIQAGVGARVIDTQPAEARNALTAIEATSRETLSGLRRMLGALRRAEPGPGDAPAGSGPADAANTAAAAAPREPAPGLADLDRLVRATGDAGVRVDVRWRGERRPLPPEIDLSAFRIVQEAVTNVVRHAGTGHCRVSIDHRDGELVVEVVDDGTGRGPAGTGYGLVGMRERAGLLNGCLTAGPRPEGGFRVEARLPVPEGVR